MVAKIGHEQVASKVGRKAVGKVELGQRRRSAITRKSGLAGAGKSSDNPLRRNTANTMSIGIGKIVISQWIGRHPFHRGEQRPGRRAAISSEIAARNGLNNICRDRGGLKRGQHQPPGDSPSTHTNIVGIPSDYSHLSR